MPKTPNTYKSGVDTGFLLARDQIVRAIRDEQVVVSRVADDNFTRAYAGGLARAAELAESVKEDTMAERFWLDETDPRELRRRADDFQAECRLGLAVQLRERADEIERLALARGQERSGTE